MNFVDSLKKWFFNNSSSAATTTSKVPLVDNTGNPIGCDTLAHLAQVQDLASVLGVTKIDVLSSKDCNNLPFGFGVYHTTSPSTVLNIPQGITAGQTTLFNIVIDVVGSGAYRGRQILLDNYNGVFQRYYDGTSWAEWSRLV